MARITITIKDSDQGQVDITSVPDFKVLLRMKRDAEAGKDGGAYTMAHSYAIVAIGSVIKLAKEITQEKVKAQFDAGLIPAVQSTRQMFG